MSPLSLQPPAATILSTVPLTGDEASIFAAVVDHNMNLVDGRSDAWPSEGSGTDPARLRPTVEAAFIHGDLPRRAHAGLALRCTRAPDPSNGWLSQIDVEEEGGRRFACEILTGFRTRQGDAAPPDMFGASDAQRARYMREVAGGDRFVPRPEAAVRRPLGRAFVEAPHAEARFAALVAFIRDHEAEVADLRGVGLRPVRRRIHASAGLEAAGAPTLATWLRPARHDGLSMRLFSILTASGRPTLVASCETLYAL